MTLASQMPVMAIARLVKEYDTRLWRIVHHYVEEARSEQDHAEVEEVGIDETASRKGHRYITTLRRPCRSVPEEAVLLGNPQPPAGRDRRGAHDQTTLERYPALV